MGPCAFLPRVALGSSALLVLLLCSSASPALGRQRVPQAQPSTSLSEPLDVFISDDPLEHRAPPRVARSDLLLHGSDYSADAGSRRRMASIRPLPPAPGETPTLRPAGSGINAKLAPDTSYYWPGIKAWTGPLTYTGGEILSDPIRVFPIYYGKWKGPNAIISAFINSISSGNADSLGNSVRKWWGIMSRYKTPSGRSISQTVTLGKNIVFNGTYKKTLSDGECNGCRDDVLGIVNDAIKKANIKPAKSDIYMVLTSSDIKVGNSSGYGFCNRYCGWHTYSRSGSVTFQYAFVGEDSPTCGCSAFQVLKKVDNNTITPHGSPSIEGIIATIAYELAVTASDPTFNGFMVPPYGLENADLCRFEAYGFKKTSSNAAFDVYGLNGYKFLLHSYADFPTQQCVMS